MKITLKRTVQLKSAVVYLKINTENRRDDIKEYLNSTNGFQNEIVERGVRRYLHDMGIYRQNQLTPYGIRVKETGMVKEKEEGKYQIWYTQGDPLFGNRIFYFRRIKPEPYNAEMAAIELDFLDRTFYSLPVQVQGKDEKNSLEFSIVEKARECEIKSDSSISCTWIWNDVRSSLFVFSGDLASIDKDKSGRLLTDNIDSNKPIDFKIDLEQHIDKIVPNWNRETRRCRLKLEIIENDAAKEAIYQYFEYSGNRSRAGYDSCVFENLPVEPYNHEEAVKWRDILLNMELVKGYIHPDEFELNINAINEKEGFCAYSELFDVPQLRKYIQELDHAKKSDRQKDYWHLAAPLDLNIGIPRSLKIEHISLEKGKNISLEDLAAQFGVSRADKVYYYDKYVTRYYQQRSVSAFLKCFGIPDICIITDTTPQSYDRYLSRNKPEIAVEDLGSIYGHNRRDAPHDRFIVFKKDNDLSIWTSTNSIDFIRFNARGEILPNTVGSINQSVTFTKVKQRILENQLYNFILRG